MTEMVVKRWNSVRVTLSRDVLISTALATLWMIGVYAGWYPFDQWSTTESWGFVTGAVSVYLAAKNNIWNWPVGIVNALFYVYLFYEARLFADMSLQMYYVIMSVVGLALWLWGGEKKSALRITHIPWKWAAGLAVATAGVVYGMTMYLRSIHDVAPFLDALTASFSFTAQFMLAKKWIENWYVWIGVDIVSIGLYYWKDLSLTAILYGIFLATCVLAAFTWRKYMKEGKAL